MSQFNLEEVPVVSTLEEVPVASVLQEEPSSSRVPSYRPYQWTPANRVLDLIDDITGGRAGICQRFVTYVIIGGIAALVNLAVFYTVFYIIKLPFDNMVRNIIASIFATEISIMANFIPNDYFTFRHLPGHSRSWAARCARFHLTSIGGSGLTFLIQFGLTHVGTIDPIVAQAAALMIVLIYNFSFHHLFTYRHVKLKTAS